MAVNIRSRYWNLPAIKRQGPDGPVSSLPVRRNLPRSAGDTVPHIVTGLDTIESIAARYYSRSDAWWHIADANAGRFPLDYHPGEQLRVPASAGIGRVLRTRD